MAAAPNKNELAALGLVNRAPMHGYRLRQAVEEMDLEQWTSLSQSSIYNALSRLAVRGAVSETTERVGKAPERTVYHITPAGRADLADLLRRALTYVGADDRLFYLGLAFVEGLPFSEVVPLLESRIEALHRTIAHEQKGLDGGCQLPHVRAMARAGCRHLQVEIELCTEVAELFRSQPDYFALFGGGDDDT